MVLLKLFFSFAKIGAMAIGGAYSFLPIVEKEVVEYQGWLSKEQFLEAAGMAEVFPGAISIKFATYTGYKTAGIAGVIAANAGNMIVPVGLMIAAVYFYSRYKDMAAVKAGFAMVRCAVFAMIIAVAVKLVNVPQFTEVKYLVVIILSFAVFAFTRIHPAFVIIAAAGALGAVLR